LFCKLFSCFQLQKGAFPFVIHLKGHGGKDGFILAQAQESRREPRAFFLHRILEAPNPPSKLFVALNYVINQ
jgi:hypothetical protein